MQYQRAVTPTIEKAHQQDASAGAVVNVNVSGGGGLKGKSFYSNQPLSSRTKSANANSSGSSHAAASSIASSQPHSNATTTSGSLLLNNAKYGSINSISNGNSVALSINNFDNQIAKNGASISGKIHSSHQHQNTTSLQQVTLLPPSQKVSYPSNRVVPNQSNSSSGAVSTTRTKEQTSVDLSNQTSLARHDLVPLSDEIPTDGIIFARIRNLPDSLIVFRTPEERIRNPERLNLDRRQLDICPILEQEQRLRLLNYQNNHIKLIQNLENLQNLIFLDMYNNKLTSLEGPLSTVRGLRVLMAGKNKISAISNLTSLRKLDVLDLHSNEIKVTEGLDGLNDLRVLNLAGNKIGVVQNLSSLQALTELNLRRNAIERVCDLDKLPSLQRVFLSHNLIRSITDIACLFEIKMLVELSLDGNPVCEINPAEFRNRLITGIKVLRHLDLKRIGDDERAIAEQACMGLDILSPLSSIVIENSCEQAGGKSNENGKDSSVVEFLHSLNINGISNDSNINVGPADSNGGKVGPLSSGLAALARLGSISASAQSFFDLEIISPNEKALTIVADSWEWVSNRRILSNVVEVSLYHVKLETITSKIVPNISWLPSMKCLRLVNNGIETIRDLESIAELYIPSVEDFYINDNPVCFSMAILKPFITTQYPWIKSFNGADITEIYRRSAEIMLKPLIQVRSKILTLDGGLSKNDARRTVLASVGKDSSRRNSGIAFRSSFCLQGPDDTFHFEIFHDLRTKSIDQRNLSVYFPKAFQVMAKQLIKDTLEDSCSNR